MVARRLGPTTGRQGLMRLARLAQSVPLLLLGVSLAMCAHGVDEDTNLLDPSGSGGAAGESGAAGAGGGGNALAGGAGVGGGFYHPGPGGMGRYRPLAGAARYSARAQTLAAADARLTA